MILGKALGHQTWLPLGGTAVKAPEEAEIPRDGSAGEEKVRDDAETGVHVTSYKREGGRALGPSSTGVSSGEDARHWRKESPHLRPL